MSSKRQEPVMGPVTFYLDPDELANLRELAEQEGRSLSGQLRFLLSKGLEAEYEQEGVTE